MAVDITKIVDKVRLLLAQTTDRGCTATEAALAAGMARRLLDEHNLSIADVEALAEQTDGGIESVEDRSREALDGWEEPLASVLAKGFDCRVYKTRDLNRRRKAVLTFVGFSADVAIARFLFTTLRREIARAARRAYRDYDGPASRYRHFESFCHGATEAIRARLGEMARQRQGNAQALICHKLDAIDRRLPSLRPARPMQRSLSHDAVHAGQAMGAKACLDGRPLPSGRTEETLALPAPEM